MNGALKLHQELAPTASQIADIVSGAMLAPSGDNCQPWRFRWDGRELAVFHDDKRGAHSLNRQNHASLLTLGCLLEAMSIASLHEGFNAEFRISPGSVGGWAKVTFRRTEKGHPATYNALLLRATDRRLYRGGKLSDPPFAAIRRRADAYPPAAIYFADRFSKPMMDYVLEAETMVWRMPGYHQDLIEWIRFDDQVAAITRDGMPWRSLGISFLESRMLKLVHQLHLQPVLNHLGVLWQLKHLLKTQIQSSAGLYCLTVKSAESRDLVAAGRLAMSAWLELNQNGYGVQPLSQASLSIFDEASGALQPDTPERFRKLFRKGREILRHCFHLPEAETPVWMFRTGLSPSLPPKSRTLRLPSSQVME